MGDHLYDELYLVENAEVNENVPVDDAEVNENVPVDDAELNLFIELLGGHAQDANAENIVPNNANQILPIVTFGNVLNSGMVIDHSIVTQINHLNDLMMTCCAIGTLLAIGCMNGSTYLFGSDHVLIGRLQPATDMSGSVTSLSFNNDSTRLLVAFEGADIVLWEVLAKGCRSLCRLNLRPNNITHILCVRFSDPSMAVIGDSYSTVGLVVFSVVDERLNFNFTPLYNSCGDGRILCLEPLLLPISVGGLAEHRLIAMASATNVVVLAGGPSVRERHLMSLEGLESTLPHLAWRSRCCGLENESEAAFLLFARDGLVRVQKVTAVPRIRTYAPDDGDLRLSELRFEIVLRVRLPTLIASIKWMNEFTVAVLDFGGQIRAVDLLSSRVEEQLSIRLVPRIIHPMRFVELGLPKIICASYETVIGHEDKMFFLGLHGLHSISLRSWTDAIGVECRTKGPEAAFLLCEGCHKGDITICRRLLGLPVDEAARKAAVSTYSRTLMTSVIDNYLPAENPTSLFKGMVNLCVAVDQMKFYTDTIFHKLAEGSDEEKAFLQALAPRVLNSAADELQPQLKQRLSAYIIVSGHTLQIICGFAAMSYSFLRFDDANQ